jgi:hypothetical protein
VAALDRVMTAPDHPSVFVLGGAKISDAFGMMKQVLERGTADTILTCGVTGEVFLLAQGHRLGEVKERFLKDRQLDVFVDDARSYLAAFPGKIAVPRDLAYAAGGERREIAIDELPASHMYKDLGRRTIAEYQRIIGEAKTLFVNGPAGVYEESLFEEGTRAIWKAIAAAPGYSVIGGGDTGADCLGTSHRQEAASVHQFEILPRPPDERPAANPWPTWPMKFRTSSAHEEGGERVYSVNTERFVGDDQGRVRALAAHEVEFVDGRFQKVEGTDFELETDLVLLAMGFVGPERAGLLEQLGVELTDRGNVARTNAYATSVADVYVCGDMGRGQSLIVWAIAEGRACAAAVDERLMGKTTLPAPVVASARPLV